MECLFQFVCSSNNHISRIHGMVERLCSTYGTPLAQQPAVAEDPLAAVANAADPVSWHHDLVSKALPMTWRRCMMYMKCPKMVIDLERWHRHLVLEPKQDSFSSSLRVLGK